MSEPLSTVEDLVRAGRLHVNRGEFPAAVRCYQDAIRRAADWPRGAAADRLRAQAHLGLALADVEVAGDPEVGLDHLELAESLLPADADDLRVALLGQRAIMLVRSGHLDDAVAAFLAAEPFLEHTSASHRASLLLNRGVLRLEMGALEEAGRDFVRAVEEADAADQPRTAYKARHNLAYLAFLEGDLPAAIAGMATAPEHRDGRVEEPDPITLMDRARVLLEGGLADEADVLLGEAGARFRAMQRGRDLGEVALVHSEAALLVGDLVRSAELARASAAHFAAGGNDRWRRRAELAEAAVVRTDLDRQGSESVSDRQDARGWLARLEDLAAETTSDPETVTGARLLAVELACRLGDVATAEDRLASVELASGAPLRLRLRWHLCRAALALARRDPGVLDVVEAGVATLAQAQAQVGSRDLRTAMALHGRPLVDIGVRAALERGSVEQLHRAMDLAHAASSRLTPVRADLGDEDRPLLAELRALEDRQWREVEADDHEREQWATRAGLLREELRRRSWRQSGDHGVQAPDPVVSLDELGAALGRHDVVAVSFVRTGDDLLALRVTGSTADPVRLGPVAPILEEVGRLRADLRVVSLPSLAPTMQSVIHESLRAGLARLDDLLAAPLDAAGRDLVLVPHADLALVPWSLLPSRTGAGTVTTPSITRWVRRRGRDGAAEPVVVGLAGPDLDRATDEVAAVRAPWPGARTSGGATGDDLRRALADADVVHLAAHGVHHAAAPLFSSVRLDDGPFYAHDLGADVAARMVVLSACDVAAHAMRPGDEPLGFAAALLDRGVDVVVGSVAPISDDVAADAGAALHRHLAAGRSPARAVSLVVADAWEDGAVAPVVVLGSGLRPVVAPNDPRAAA